MKKKFFVLCVLTILIIIFVFNILENKVESYSFNFNNSSSRIKEDIMNLCKKGKYDFPDEFLKLDIPYLMLASIGYILEEIEDFATVCLSEIGKNTKYGKFLEVSTAMSNFYIVLRGGVPDIIGGSKDDISEYVYPICDRIFKSIDEKVRSKYNDKNIASNDDLKELYNIDISTYLKFKNFCENKVASIEKNIFVLGKTYMEMKKNDEYYRKILSKLGDINSSLEKVVTKLKSLVNEISDFTNKAAPPTKASQDIFNIRLGF